MKSFLRLPLTQRLRLIGGLAMFGFGICHLLLYLFGYPITFGIPGTSFHGSGSKIASVYLIIAMLGVMLYRPAIAKMRALDAEA